MVSVSLILPPPGAPGSARAQPPGYPWPVPDCPDPSVPEDLRGPRTGEPSRHPDFSVLDTWFDRHARDLPMRGPDVSPWATLVFEVMSQQTPIPRVQPIWEAWMQRWPSPGSLAEAPTAEVLLAWDRLGYPSRALRLQQCAAAIAARPGGRVPADMDELLALPGIGPYTASAVASFAYHRRVAVLDTNVRRVLARSLGGIEFAPSSTPGRAERARAESLLPAEGAVAARRNLAWMELGALVCTQRSPRCPSCPLVSTCAWFLAGSPPATSRPRGQAWAGTDRQARGRVMALLRSAHAAGTPVTQREALDAATLPGAPPEQPRRVLDGLLADGLATRDASEVYIHLPGALPKGEGDAGTPDSGYTS